MVLPGDDRLVRVDRPAVLVDATPGDGEVAQEHGQPLAVPVLPRPTPLRRGGDPASVQVGADGVDGLAAEVARLGLLDHARLRFGDHQPLAVALALDPVVVAGLPDEAAVALDPPVDRMVGGTVGLAVVGALVTTIGRSRLDSSLPQLPVAARAKLAGALGSGVAPDGHTSPRLVNAVHDAFVSALTAGLKVGAAVAFVGALLALWLFGPMRTQPSETRPSERLAAEASRGAAAQAAAAQTVRSRPAWPRTSPSRRRRYRGPRRRLLERDEDLLRRATTRQAAGRCQASPRLIEIATYSAWMRQLPSVALFLRSNSSRSSVRHSSQRPSGTSFS